MGLFGNLFSSHGFIKGKFGETFALSVGHERMVAELVVRFAREKGPGRSKVPTVLLTLHAEQRSADLESFPLNFGRYRVELVEVARKSASFCVSEIACRDEDFQKIKSNTSGESICTPLIDKFDWYGIAINAPSELLYQESRDRDQGDSRFIANKEPKLIIAGIYCFEYAKIRAQHFPRDHDPVVHIKNSSTGQTSNYTTRQLERGYVHHVLGMNVSYAPDSVPDLDESDDADRNKTISLGSSFNADIGMHLERPKKPTSYEVYAECGPYRSNTVTIIVRP